DKSLPLANLTKLLAPLSQPPSIQPANSLRLSRTVSQAFGNNSDMAPRLLGAFLPSAAPLLYQAWSNLETATAAAIEVGAARVKAGLFPGAYPGLPTVTTGDSQNTTSFDNSPTISTAWIGLGTISQGVATIALDAVYDKILSNSWVMIDSPSYSVVDGDIRLDGGRRQTFHKIVNTTVASMTTGDGGFTAKVTQLTLDRPWLDGDGVTLRELKTLPGL